MRPRLGFLRIIGLASKPVSREMTAGARTPSARGSLAKRRVRKVGSSKTMSLLQTITQSGVVLRARYWSSPHLAPAKYPRFCGDARSSTLGKPAMDSRMEDAEPSPELLSTIRRLQLRNPSSRDALLRNFSVQSF